MDKPADKIADATTLKVSSDGLANDPLIGRVVAEKFEVIERIDAGGMGIVYRVRHRSLRRDYAMKVLLNSGPYGFDVTQLERFQREAQAVSGLHHQNLVSVIDFGTTDDGLPYLVMELINGQSLAKVIRDSERLDQKEALEIFRQVCDGVEYAHSKGVIHRDLKPSNVMVGRDESGITVRILDFGIAKFSEGKDVQRTLTQTGEIVGSPPYMSPEQAMGYKLDTRSDIYSLGCMLFEMLAGRPPFIGESPLAVVVQHLNSDPPELNQIPEGRRVRAELSRVVWRMIQKKPEHRYQSISDLKQDIDLVIAGKTPTGTPPQVLRGRRPGKRSGGVMRLLLTAVCFAVLGISALLALAIYGSMASRDPLDSTVDRMISYNKENKGEEALIVGDQALQSDRGSRDRAAFGRFYDQMSEAALVKGRYPLSIDYAKKAAAIKRATHQPPQFLAHSIGRMGQAYRRNKNYAEAEAADKEALEILANGNVVNYYVSDLQLQLSNLMSDQNRTAEALHWAKLSAKTSAETRGAADPSTIRLQHLVQRLEKQLAGK